MALYILGPDSAGTCCTCAERATPCDTCEEPGECLECRTLGGNASFCGFSPFQNQTTPPTSYLTKTFEGTTQDYQGVICGIATNSYEWGGTATYDASTCAPVNNLYRLTNGIPDVPPPIFFSTPLSQASCNVGNVLTDTTKGYEGLDFCDGCFDGTQFVPYKTVGTAIATLSNPDTESNAIARLLASSTWTDWAILSECASIWSINTSGFFAYLKAQWRVRKTGLLPNRYYDLTIVYYRKLTTESEWTVYQTTVYEEFTDSSGNATFTDDIPMAQGYATKATTNCIAIPA